ncbi:MAG: hypothetical protein Q8M29_08050 [Bacteroidota bacterium]|nr:hypothetical protein [Bacteroidota bacterium]
MYQQPSRKIEFRRQRDFGQIFTDSFKYLKFNFKTLMISVLLIPGPLLLIAGGFNGYLQSISSNPASFFTMGGMSNIYDMLSSMLTVMLPYLFFFFLASVVFNAVVNRYLILSQERQEGDTITVSDLMKYLPKDAWRLFYNYLLFTLVSMLVMVGVVLLMFIPILGILMFIFGILLVGPNLMYAVTNSSYLVLRDEILITQAFSKTWRYMRGNYWYTWLLLVVSYLIISIASSIFSLPQIILSTVNTLSRFNPENYGQSDGGNYSTLFIIFGMIAVLGQFLIMPLLNIFTTLTYHSHEEAEDGTGLKERINEIGLDN